MQVWSDQSGTSLRNGLTAYVVRFAEIDALQWPVQNARRRGGGPACGCRARVISSEIKIVTPQAMMVMVAITSRVLSMVRP